MYFKMFLYVIFLVWHGSNVFQFGENTYKAGEKRKKNITGRCKSYKIQN